MSNAPLRKAEQHVLRALITLDGQATNERLLPQLVTYSQWWKRASALPISLTAWVCSDLIKKGLVRAETKQLYSALQPGEEGAARPAGTIMVYSITEEGRRKVDETQSHRQS
jgi:hypothetical protein